MNVNTPQPRCQRTIIVSTLASLMLVAAATTLADPATSRSSWPQFRGPDATGIADVDVFSKMNGVALDVAWKRPIGSGYSGIAVAGGLVATMFSDETSDFLIAFDEESGKERWRYEIGPTYKGHDGSHTGPISTPLIAGNRVFGLAPRGRFFALDIESGKPAWSIDLVEAQKSKKPHYGFSTSPIMHDGVLVLQLGAEDAAVAGFDPTSGKRLWTVGSDKVDYQSPISVEIDGRRQILAVGEKQILGIDPKTGESLWQHEHGGGGARGLASVSPVPAGDRRLFLAFKDDASTVLKLASKDGAIAVETVWEDRSIRNSYNVPVYHDGHIYAYSSRFLTCVNADTGKSVWRSRQPGDGFLILVDGHLVIVTKKNGGVHVVKASSEGCREIAGIPVFDEVAWGHPSFANGRIYVRSMSEIARVDIRPGTALARKADKDDPMRGDSEFGRFLKKVAGAADKKSVVDEFMASQQRFPIVERDVVTFVYRGPAEDVAVGGDLFGARQERAMKRVAGTDLFYYSTRVEPDARFNYMFLKDYKGLIDPLNDRKTTTVLFGDEMEFSFSGEMEMSWAAMPQWKAPAHLDPADETRRGKIETKEIDSKILEAKHSFDVYLPTGYQKSDRRYPVAYVHEGKAAKERGNWPNSLDNLLGTRIEPIIVVFLGPAAQGQNDKHSDMIAKELVPFIDENYRTVASPDARAAVGAGFAAFNAIHSVFKNPGVMQKLGCQSAFMFDSMLKGLQPLIDDAEKRSLTFYFGWGKYDLRSPDESWDLAEKSQAFAKMMKDKGYPAVGGEFHDGTGWSSWKNRTDTLLEALFPISGSSSTK